MTKKERARKWVNGYTATGTALAVVAIVPGTTTLALCTLEQTMCYQIGKIYKGDDYKLADAVQVAGVIGIVGLLAKAAALEALNFVPFAGWVAKGAIAGSIIKSMGEIVIQHYEDEGLSNPQSSVTTTQ
jgi:uncharacterized protein (DUF697 family)